MSPPSLCVYESCETYFILFDLRRDFFCCQTSGYLTSSLLIFYEASRWTEIGGFLKSKEGAGLDEL